MGILPEKFKYDPLYDEFSRGFDIAIGKCEQAVAKAVEKACNVEKLDHILSSRRGYMDRVPLTRKALIKHIKSCFE